MTAHVQIRSSDRLAKANSLFSGGVRLSEPFPGSPPLWIEPADNALITDIEAVAEWMTDNHDAIEQALLLFGAVVWRGFPVDDTDEFITMMRDFTPYAQGYAGGTSNRKAIKGDAMEATRTPPEVYIQLHQEMSYMPQNPRALAFFCKKASDEGGETVICDMRGFLEELPDELRRKFEEQDAVYVRNLRSQDVDDWRAKPEFRHASWQYWFDSEDRDVVSAQLEERGTEYSWNEDGSLTFWNRTPAVAVHPRTGDRVYFNQLNSQIQNAGNIGEERYNLLFANYGDHTDWPYAVRFGNGDPVTDEDYQVLRAALEARKIAFSWQGGDVMLLDNKLTAHGRHPYAGERDVQVMLFQ
jgi:alpha-ketoglutarate-dependent taurine dioxygenase